MISYNEFYFFDKCFWDGDGDEPCCFPWGMIVEIDREDISTEISIGSYDGVAAGVVFYNGKHYF